MQVCRPAVRVASIAFLFGGLALPLAAQNTKALSIQACVDAARLTARNYYRLESHVAWERYFHDAFCEAVHRKQTNNTSVGVAGVLADILKAIVNVSVDQLDEFDRNYCRQTSSFEQFTRSISVWQSVVEAGAQKEFTNCLKTALQNGGSLGVKTEAKETEPDACNFTLETSYHRSARSNPSSASLEGKPIFIGATCARPRNPIDETTQTVACKRTGWGPVQVAFDTSQGPIYAELAARKPPARPVLDPPVPDADKRQYQFNQEKLKMWACTGNMKDGDVRFCGISSTVPDGGKAVSVTYVCQAANNYWCNWSDTVIAPSGDGRTVAGSITYRTPRDLNHIFTVTYEVPHAKTPEELERIAKYAEQTRVHSAILENGPCYTPPKAPTAKKVIAKN